MKKTILIPIWIDEKKIKEAICSEKFIKGLEMSLNLGIINLNFRPNQKDFKENMLNYISKKFATEDVITLSNIHNVLLNHYISSDIFPAPLFLTFDSVQQSILDSEKLFFNLLNLLNSHFGTPTSFELNDKIKYFIKVTDSGINAPGDLLRNLLRIAKFFGINTDLFLKSAYLSKEYILKENYNGDNYCIMFPIKEEKDLVDYKIRIFIRENIADTIIPMLHEKYCRFFGEINYDPSTQNFVFIPYSIAAKLIIDPNNKNL